MNIFQIGNWFMNRFVLPFRIALSTLFIISITSCEKKTEIPKGMVKCPWDISIPVPIEVNNTESRKKLYDTLIFSINVPFKNFNLGNNDSIDLSIFSELWGGALIVRMIHDSVANGGINSPGGRSDFKWKTATNIFELRDKNTKPNEALLFKYEKLQNCFQLTLKLVPQQKGTYQIIFLSSAFRDAFCGNGLRHSFVDYSNSNFSYLIEEAIGRKLIGDDPYQYIAGNYILRVE
jgi:hypothetical protein